MSTNIYHKHHIIPRHMGGSNDSSNIEMVTVEEHAERHRILYEQHGHWKDKIAWLGLSGQIGKEEIILEAGRLANTGRKHSEETKRKIGIGNKGKLGSNLGKTFTKEHKEKISLKLKGIPRPWSVAIGKANKGKMERDTKGRFFKKKN